MSDNEVTDHDLIAAIQQYMDRPADKKKEPGTTTSREYSEENNIPIGRVRKTLKEMAGLGLIQAKMVWRIDLWDHFMWVKGFKKKGESDDTPAKAGQ